MHGITEDKVSYVRNAILTTGKSQTDGHGKHSSRPHKLSDESKEKVFTVLKSLKGKKSHYSLKDTQKLYLPDELNISKLHGMYVTENPS